MSPTGSVVVDWANAARDDALFDVAASYVLLTCPEMPGPRALGIALQPVRVLLAKEFAKRYRGRELNERIGIAAEMKTFDANMTPAEVLTMQRLARRMRRRTA